ncbi:MAG: UDP-3-O-(3-hydroxymyristoyl)glucosamine N-acyltransferase [Rubripirellula sp.]
MTRLDSTTNPARTTLSELAVLVSGRLVGSGDLRCCGANPPADAISGEVTLLDNPKRVDSIRESEASAVVTSAEVDLEGRAQIIVDNPHLAFGKIVEHFRPAITPVQVHEQMPSFGVDDTATVADSARVHPTAIIGAGVTIGERTLIMPGVVVMPQSVIGDDCVIHSHVTLYEYTNLQDRVVIHSGSVIGAYGFGYRQQNGRHMPTSQLGYVQVESDVEIGACVTIDRGTYGVTRIGEGTKIDNQVQIGHNCTIGPHNLLCSQAGIAGSCRTGEYVILAGQAGLKDHITLGDRTIIAAQAGVMDNLEGDEVYFGSPATTQRRQMQILAVQRKLPEIRKDLKRIRRELDELLQLRDATQQHDTTDQRDNRAA